MAVDRFGRNIHYLRVSLTDRCNYRCVYCMPEDTHFVSAGSLLADDELVRLVGVFVSVGFDKFRLTGGEPTVRRDVVGLVGRLAATPGVGQITMTTNGHLLEELAGPLAEAGLARVNVSLDTLNPDRFRAITRRGDVDSVLRGLQAAEAAGLTPVKVNAVVARDYNVEDVIDLAGLTRDHPWEVRFIEMMPFAGTADFNQSNLVPEAEIMGRIASVYGPLTPVDGGRLRGEARLYRMTGARGAVGFISSVSAPFCAGCARVRLTADGRLRLCLLRDGEVDLLTPLRAGASDAELGALIRAGVWRKPWGHGLADDAIPTERLMSQIGG